MAFRLPTHVTLEPGSFSALPETIADLGARRVLLVYDRGLASVGWPERARVALSDSGAEVESFDGIEANPRLTTVDGLADRVRSSAVDAVVGLGGGSVLDAAKAVAMLATNPGSAAHYEGRDLFGSRPLPFVAIPTTCGTGSEVTWVSVISLEDEQRKMSVKGEGMFPDRALVDADLLATLPANLVAWTGLDALTHSVEAYTCTMANPVSDALAEKAISLLLRYLPRAWKDIEGDGEAREAVMRASTTAGIAFGNADVAGVHCLSETIGGIWDTPHGLANAILLAPVLRFHMGAARPKLESLHAAVFGGAVDDPARAVVEEIESLVSELETPSFRSLGIESRDLRRIAEGAVANNSNDSNPQPMGVEQYLEILEGIA